MVIMRLAYRNLIGAGLKTWLKVAVLSMSYVLITWHFGFFTGMFKQAARAMINDEIAGGQLWHEKYDPYDPFTLEDSHGVIPAEIEYGKMAPILIRQATIFPEGRVQSILLKGIEPEQSVLAIPTANLADKNADLPLMIGKRMARKNSFKIGDYIMIRWRDAKGTFNAAEGKVSSIMSTDVPTIDSGQIWLPLKKLQEMSELKNEATIIVVAKDFAENTNLTGWKFRDLDFLLNDLNEMVSAKKISAGIMYFVLLLLAMISIFDTQILSIFRRKREIGTLMALGMTRGKVVSLFTLEGAMISVLAAAAACIWGTPLIYYTATRGIKFPEIVEDYGFAISSTLFPSYTAGLVLTTLILIMAVTTVVSYLPARKISKLKPTEALKGKIS